MTEIVRQTPVLDGDVHLLVSTVRIARGYYDTVIFDESDNKPYTGKVLPAHESEGVTYGPYVIDKTNIRSDSRNEALFAHREALYAARTETPA
ncbi:hypothetical protein [Streptomyces sp. NPDC020983]|uniref:hypothetical protein n=1 Tax=Streptomyces sp. NPDC020983 TaxID=3365106 RepID=UPI00379AF513